MTILREVLRDNGYRARDCLEGRGGGASLAAASHHVGAKEHLVTERGTRGRGKDEGGTRETERDLTCLVASEGGEFSRLSLKKGGKWWVQRR